MAGDIVDALGVVPGCGQPVAIGFVINLEFDVFEQLFIGGCVRGHVRENLGQVHAEAMNVAVIDQGIVVVAGAALPGQNYLVIIAVVAADKACVGVDDRAVGHTHGIVGVTGVQGSVGIGGAAVNFFQTGRGHIHGHMTVIIGIAYRKLAGTCIPRGDLVCAAIVSEELH